MHQSRTLYIGVDVHKAASAGAYVAHAHHAAVVSLGHIATRPCALDHLIRQMPSPSTQRICVSEAGPCGYWRYRSLIKKGPGCWGVAPSLSPNKPGDRVKTNRRDAITLARLMRSGDLTPGDVPQVEAAAMRDLGRARADTSRALQAAQCPRTAWLLRHDIR
jgi:hypothetical protein